MVVWVFFCVVVWALVSWGVARDCFHIASVSHYTAAAWTSCQIVSGNPLQQAGMADGVVHICAAVEQLEAEKSK